MAPASEGTLNNTQQKKARAAGGKQCDAAEPAGARERMRNGRQRGDRKQHERDHCNDPVEKYGQHDLLEGERELARHPDPDDVAANRSQRQEIEKDTGIEKRLHGRERRRPPARQRGQDRTPSLGAKANLQ